MASANLIYGPGMLESGITFDFAQLVLDNEFIGMIKHAIRGMAVDDESLAVDVIKAVGPSKDFPVNQKLEVHTKIISHDFFNFRPGGSLVDIIDGAQRLLNFRHFSAF